MKSPDINTVSKMTDLPNIGKAISADLERIGLTDPKQLIGKDAYELHKQLSEKLRRRQDNCVIDVFLSVISFMEGGEALPWWHFTQERKSNMK